MISFPFKNTYFLLVFLMFFSLISCKQKNWDKSKKIADSIAFSKSETLTEDHIIVGANRLENYLDLIKNKRISIVANQTSVIFKEDGTYTHLVDSLLRLSIKVSKVFSPEHGFRGKADAGEKVTDGKDLQTGLPIISLYGKNRKPSAEQLENLDLVVFDIQDVGVRFYTYISTMHYVMEACAEAGIPVIVLDRPNPNGHYVDGPTLEIAHKSFVGMHPIPLVYGMTIGEYAQMINGQQWLKNGIQCELTVITLKNYQHKSSYHLPIRPSPNLPNDKSINLYPSLGFFEGTIINAGRGTESQFQRYGAPFFPKSEFSYTPQPNFGSKSPKHNGKLCYGENLENEKRLSEVSIQWIWDAFTKTPKTEKFFGPSFTRHAGSTELEQQLKDRLSATVIHESWQPKVEQFKKVRAKYLIYD